MEDYKMRRIQIGVIGPEEKNILERDREKFLSLSFEIGKNLAKAGVITVTGGCTGIAEYVSRGAYTNGGITVATPGPDRLMSVPYTTVEICTPINVGDFVFAGTLTSDVLIVFPGDAGTLAEIAIAYRYKKPLILLKGISEGILEELFNVVSLDYPQYVVSGANEAVSLAITLAQAKLNKDKTIQEDYK
jgi:uncharacterized protein (TIGR00725 family)